MHRKLFYFILILGIVLGIAPVWAQESSPDLDLLAVELWPDYDETAVLVLFTGTLVSSATLPATVTLPLPEGADVHAVARISSDNVMVDDIAFEVNESAVTLTTPDDRFRVEYYLPYEADGTNHSFDASWTFPYEIASVTIDVQQPAMAADFNVTPAAAEVVTGQDGLTYHRSASRALAAGQPLTIDFSYTLPGNQLTQPLLQQTNDATSSQASDTGAVTETATASSNLPLILAGIGGLIISGTLIWQGLRERSQQQQQKKKPSVRRHTPRATSAPSPTPKRAAPPVSTSSAAAKFCHECGREAQPEDRFCRQCGTALKGR